MDLGLTALELARIQFAFTVSFHIIFPALCPVLWYGRGLWRGDELSVWYQLE